MNRYFYPPLALVCGALALGGETTVVQFEGDDTGGWIGPLGLGGATNFDPDDGTPAPSLRTGFQGIGITFRNESNPAWVRDYSAFDRVTFSFNVKVNLIRFGFTPVSRPLVLDLRDFDSTPAGFAWSSVWFKFADVSQLTHGQWTTFSVTIENPKSADLPAGWRGDGALDGSFEPVLPPGVTFADVLRGVDRVALTTLQPGMVFGESLFDVAIDAVTVTVEGGAGGGCNPADLAQPFGILDLADIHLFVSSFIAQETPADLAPPFGVWDLTDVQAFAGAFTSGCP